MPDIAIGNSASWDGNTSNAATIASSLGSNYASASSGALTLKNGVSWNNNDSNNPFVSRAGSSSLDIVGGASVTSNTQGPLTVNAGALGAAVTVSSGVYLWSDDISQAAIIITGSCTVTNSGYIIGKGGKGGDFGAAENGGHAIEILSGVSGVTITNNSGAYIAGGGGGGGGGTGGGGAGGGDGIDYSANGGGTAGSGGALNTAGGNGTGGAAGAGGGYGGGAGGGAGGYVASGAGLSNQTGGGGGGGRILPGSGGAGGYGTHGYTGNAGGAAGNNAAQTTNGSGGGGGWGANGSNAGNSSSRAGGSGGSGVEDNGNTYTLTNNGTIYGST